MHDVQVLAIPARVFKCHVSLGGQQRIQRGAMNSSHLERRKQVLDAEVQVLDAEVDQKLSEIAWIDSCLTVMEDLPADTRIRDVIPEKPS